MDVNNLVKDIRQQLKSVFDFGPKTLIGLDIAQSAVKASIITTSKKGSSDYKLEFFKNIPLSEGAIIEDEVQKIEELEAAIKDSIKGAGSGINKVIIGLGGSSTYSKRLQLAGGSIDEIEEQVSWEAEQYIPFDVNNAALSFHVIGENEGGGVDAVVAAAKLDFLEERKNIIQSTGLNLKIVDMNIVALVNFFEMIKGEELLSTDSSSIILDVGAQSTLLVIYRDRSLMFTKELKTGGLTLTEDIQRQMGMKYEDAENLKIFGDGNGNLPEDITELTEVFFESFLEQLKKTVESYVASSSDESFEKIFLTGGGSLIPGLQEGIESVLGLEVEFLNPFDKLSYSNKFTDEELEYIGYRGAVSIGLAMRNCVK